jgi:hypothetical protein
MTVQALDRSVDDRRRPCTPDAAQQRREVGAGAAEFAGAAQRPADGIRRSAKSRELRNVDILDTSRERG